MAEILLLVLGAGLGYIAGWLQKVLDEKRQRKSAATGLLAEYVRIKSMLEYLVEDWRGDKAIAEFNIPMHDKVPDYVILFQPLAVARLLDFSGHVIGMRRNLRFLNSVENPEQKKRMVKEIKELAENALKRGELAKESLIKAGARELVQPPLIRITHKNA